MPSLEAYRRELEYSYAPGIFPSLECMLKRPELVRRLLISEKGKGSDGVARLTALAEEKRIRVEVADKALSRVSGKENCFAAAVFEKRPAALDAQADHIVLHHIADQGNLHPFFKILNLIRAFRLNDIIGLIYSLHITIFLLIIIHFLISFKTSLKTKMAKMLLANSITLTPGTITVSLRDDVYMVHCYDKSMAKGLNNTVFEKKLLKLEEGFEE